MCVCGGGGGDGREWWEWMLIIVCEKESSNIKGDWYHASLTEIKLNMEFLMDQE